MQAFPAGGGGGGELLHKDRVEDAVMQCWVQACAGYLSNWFPGDQAIMVHLRTCISLLPPSFGKLGKQPSIGRANKPQLNRSKPASNLGCI